MRRSGGKDSGGAVGPMQPRPVQPRPVQKVVTPIMSRFFSAHFPPAFIIFVLEPVARWKSSHPSLGYQSKPVSIVSQLAIIFHNIMLLTLCRASNK